MTDPIRVMVVDDHEVVRRGLIAYLRAFKDMEFVGQATDGEEAVLLAAQLKPDVILMDMVMPNLDGIEATRQIHQAHPHIRVLSLTSMTDSDLIRQALEAGASGYLNKNTSVKELSAAIHNAVSTPQVS